MITKKLYFDESFANLDAKFLADNASAFNGSFVLAEIADKAATADAYANYIRDFTDKFGIFGKLAKKLNRYIDVPWAAGQVAEKLSGLRGTRRMKNWGQTPFLSGQERWLSP